MPLKQPAGSALQRLWLRIKGQFIQAVPKDIAVCEFDCRKPQCFQGEWETCEKRLSGATGGVKPASKTEEIRAKTGTHD